MQIKERYYDRSIDILRSLAIMAVVLIHTTTTTIQASSNDLTDFSFSLFLNQAFRFAVPMFFIISGYVLELNYDFHSSFITYFKKRVTKIIIPYVFWSLLYYVFIFKNQPESFLRAIFYGEASYHLYFIPSLFIFYIFFPLLHKFIHILYKPIILFIFALVQTIPLIYDYYYKPLPFLHPVSIVILNCFPFIYGMVFAKKREVIDNLIHRLRHLLIPLIFLLAIFIYTEGKGRYFKTSNYLSFYSQWRPSVYLYSLLLTSVLQYYLRKKQFYSRIIKTISKLSFFVYFVHIAVLTYLWNIMGLPLYNYLTNGNLGRVVFDIILFTLVSGISLTIAFVANKIPNLSKITG